MTLTEIVTANAEAIERALHEGLLPGAGALPNIVITEAIAAVAREAGAVPGGLRALLAGDYDDDPAAFCRRMHAALRLAAQINTDSHRGDR